MNEIFARKLEAWRKLTPNCRVKGNGHRLEQSTSGLSGTFLGYSLRGYARVRFDSAINNPDVPDIWLVHPESLDVIEE